jgi:hypothetical protein
MIKKDILKVLRRKNPLLGGVRRGFFIVED